MPCPWLAQAVQDQHKANLSSFQHGSYTLMWIVEEVREERKSGRGGRPCKISGVEGRGPRQGRIRPRLLSPPPLPLMTTGKGWGGCIVRYCPWAEAQSKGRSPALDLSFLSCAPPQQQWATDQRERSGNWRRETDRESILLKFQHMHQNCLVS